MTIRVSMAGRLHTQATALQRGAFRRALSEASPGGAGTGTGLGPGLKDGVTRRSGGPYDGLTQLGRATGPAPSSPGDATLERVPNPHPGQAYVTRFTCPEFTSLCPVTGQPDFAHIVIDYVPHLWLVESKSLKLYLTSFRNHPDFHEACSLTIANTLVQAIAPTWLRLGAYWFPRGGIPIDVFYATGQPPKGIWIPDQGCPSYRGRG